MDNKENSTPVHLAKVQRLIDGINRLQLEREEHGRRRLAQDHLTRVSEGLSFINKTHRRIKRYERSIGLNNFPPRM